MSRNRGPTQNSLQKGWRWAGVVKRIQIILANLILDFQSLEHHQLFFSPSLFLVSYLFFSPNICFFLIFIDWIHLTGSSSTDLPLSQFWSCGQFHCPQPSDYSFLLLVFEKGNPRHVAPGTISWNQESRVIFCKHSQQISIIQQACVSGLCAYERRST